MATTRRFFVENIGREALLTGEAYAHANNVLRLRAGDEVVLFDGSGTEYSAVVAAAEKGALRCTVTAGAPSQKECKTPVALFCGALKGDKTELVVQKATELGVCEIGVFGSRYCSAYMNENKMERLKKVAREAAKQCLRAVAPEVCYFADFESALSSAAECKNKLFACEFAATSDCRLESLSGQTAVVIGSEGGFSEEEYAIAVEKYAFSTLSLGRRILRAETAAIAALSIVMYSLGELK